MFEASAHILEIPYRCPKCGNERNFKTLSHLKSHLEAEHSYLSPSKGQTKIGRQSPLTQCYTQEAQELERQLRVAKETEICNRLLHSRSLDAAGSPYHSTVQSPRNPFLSPRIVTPVFESSTVTSPRLHHDLGSNQVTRTNAALTGLWQLSGAPVTASGDVSKPYKFPENNTNDSRSVSFQVPNTQEPTSCTNLVQEIAANGHQHGVSKVSNAQVVPPGVIFKSPYSELASPTTSYRNNINALADEIQGSRQQQWITNNSLYRTRDNFGLVQPAGDNVTYVQQNVIEKLRDELQLRDTQLQKANLELHKLTEARRKLQRELLDVSKWNECQQEMVGQLEEQVQVTKGCLAEKDREIREMNNYLKTAAEKETEARQKLEEFINSLMDRAEKAEGQLQAIKYGSGARQRSASMVHPPAPQAGEVSVRQAANVLETCQQLPDPDSFVNHLTSKLPRTRSRDALNATYPQYQFSSLGGSRLQTTPPHGPSNLSLPLPVGSSFATPSHYLRNPTTDFQYRHESSRGTYMKQQPFGCNNKGSASKGNGHFGDAPFTVNPKVYSPTSDYGQWSHTSSLPIKPNNTTGTSTGTVQGVPSGQHQASPLQLRKAGNEGTARVEHRQQPSQSFDSSSEMTASEDAVVPQQRPLRNQAFPAQSFHPDSGIEEGNTTSPFTGSNSLPRQAILEEQGRPSSSNTSHGLELDENGILWGREHWPVTKPPKPNSTPPRQPANWGHQLANGGLCAQPSTRTDCLHLECDHALWDGPSKDIIRHKDASGRTHIPSQEKDPIKQLKYSTKTSLEQQQVMLQNQPHVLGKEEELRKTPQKQMVKMPHELPDDRPIAHSTCDVDIAVVTDYDSGGRDDTDLDSIDCDDQHFRVPNVPIGEAPVKKKGSIAPGDREGKQQNGSNSGTAGSPKDQGESSTGPKAINRTHKSNCSKERRQLRDALFCVFMYLDTETLGQVSQVCKDWRVISRHPALWRVLKFERKRMCSKYLQTISLWCSQLQSLRLEGLKPRPKRFNESIDEYYKNTRGSLEDGLECVLQASTKTLASIRIVDCGHILTDRCLWLISCHGRTIERLAYVSDTDPAGPEVIWALGAGCRNISTLIIPPLFPNQQPQKFNNRCVQMIGKCWPLIQVLCIGGLDVDVRGLTALCQMCPRLQVLELDHMCEVTEDVAIAMCQAGLRGLDTLDFTFTPVTPQAVIHFNSACPQLRCISLHIGISDYFADVDTSKHKEQFIEIINKLKSLKGKPEFQHILHIREDWT